MLSLSKKFFNDTNYLSSGYKTAFNPTKNKLTFYKTDKHLIDSEEITKRVNELQKPTFSEITLYRNCHKKLKAINQSIDPEKGAINLESFNENFKPTSAELKKQVWAVHATNILPKDTITPVVSHALTQEVILGVTNTTHFALGELVRPHAGGSWEGRPFAIITPLSSIIDQAVNIFAQDTFITGKWELKKETIVLVPEGTDTSELKDKLFSVISYKSSEVNLRKAIDVVIQEKKGLSFRMLGDTPALGSKVFLDEDININTPSFFESLLKEKQGMLSFGDHSHSQVGDAFLFGIIRQLLAELLAITSHPNPLLKLFYRPSLYIDYHLTKVFYNKIKDKYFSQEEQQNIEKLLSAQEKEVPNRQNIKDPLWPHLIPEYFQGMNQIEMHEFRAKHSDLFDGQENEFKAAWGVSRWFSIGYKQGLEEGLNKFINTEIEQFIKINPKSFYVLFTSRTLDLLNLHNKTYSDRLAIVNAILNLEAFKAYKHVVESNTAESEVEKILQQLLVDFSIAT